MKYFSLFALAAVLGVAFATDTCASVIGINNIQELASIGIDSSMPLSGNYILNGDINASGFAFNPIGGTLGNEFIGTFDGGGHTIRNLNIGNAGPFVGMFGYIGGQGTVKNLNLTGEVINSTGALGNRSGGISGQNDGSISNSYITGSLNLSGSVAWAGGLSGINFGTIHQSHANTTITALNGGARGINIGGLAGYNNGLIQQSFASGNIAINTLDGVAGGLVGFNQSSVIQSHSNVSIQSNNLVYALGGLAGANQGSITQTYATGPVIGDSFIGGLVGQENNIGTISQSYATGRLSSAGGTAGGIAGDYRLCCSETGVYANNYWDTQSTGQISDQLPVGASTGLTTAQLQSGTLPAGFDPSVWSTTAGEYPKLTVSLNAEDVLKNAIHVFSSTGSEPNTWTEFKTNYDLVSKYPANMTTYPPDHTDPILDFLAEGIGATLIPNLGLSLTEAAALIGFDHFNWVQGYSETPSGPLTLDPSLICYQSLVDLTGNPCPNRDSRPTYLDEQYTIDGIAVYDDAGKRVTDDPALQTRLQAWTQNEHTLLFSDSPNVPLYFVTCLAGVRSDATVSLLSSAYCFYWNTVSGEPSVPSLTEGVGVDALRTYFPGFFDGDSLPDLARFAELQNLILPATVPEPSSLYLLIIGLAIFSAFGTQYVPRL